MTLNDILANVFVYLLSFSFLMVFAGAFGFCFYLEHFRDKRMPFKGWKREFRDFIDVLKCERPSN